MKNSQGFMALFSVIIISLLLLVVAVTLNFTGFFARFNVLDTELKARASALADACLDHAMLAIAEDDSYTGDENINVEGDPCHIYHIDVADTVATITTHAEYSNANATFKAEFDFESFTITSYRELSTSP